MVIGVVIGVVMLEVGIGFDGCTEQPQVMPQCRWRAKGIGRVGIGHEVWSVVVPHIQLAGLHLT